MITLQQGNFRLYLPANSFFFFSIRHNFPAGFVPVLVGVVAEALGLDAS